MADQVQCPNCGGYKVRVDDVQSSGQWEGTGKAIPLKKTGCLFSFTLILFGLFFVYLSLGENPNWVLMAIGAILIGGGLYVFNLLRIARGDYVEQAKKYSYHCYLCGYQWTWRTDEPLPKGNIRPDLITKGEQKLEEERKRKEEEYRHAGMWMNKK